MSATDTTQATKDRMRTRERAREKDRVLRDLDKAWRGFIDSTKGIPASLMTEAGVVNNWSVRDLLAHISAWDRMTTRVTMQIIRGDQPEWPVHLQKFDDLNYEADKNLSVTEARNRALSAHKALVEMLDGKPEVRAEWVRGAAINHYAEHTAHILAWRQAHPQISAPAAVRSGEAHGEEASAASVSSAHDNVPSR